MNAVAVAELLAQLKETPHWFGQPTRDRLARIRGRDPDVFEPKDVHELVLARVSTEPAIVSVFRTAGRLLAQFDDLAGHDAVRRRVQEVQDPLARLRSIYTKHRVDFDPRVGELLRDNSFPNEAREELLTILEVPASRPKITWSSVYHDQKTKKPAIDILRDGEVILTVRGGRCPDVAWTVFEKQGEVVPWTFFVERDLNQLGRDVCDRTTTHPSGLRSDSGEEDSDEANDDFDDRHQRELERMGTRLLRAGGGKDPREKHSKAGARVRKAIRSKFSADLCEWIQDGDGARFVIH